MSYHVGYVEIDYTSIDFDIILEAGRKTAHKLYINLLFNDAVPFSRVDIDVCISDAPNHCQELILSLCGIYEAASRAHIDLQCEVLLPCSQRVSECSPAPEVAFRTENKEPFLNQQRSSGGLQLLPTCTVAKEAHGGSFSFFNLNLASFH